jgi:serine/threonine protein kinase
MIGKQAGNYKFTELLGEGGMGTVYKAVDTRTGESVAIKALKNAVVKRSPDALDRFIREGETLRQLNHPNIIHLYDAFEHDGMHCIVMEYIEGGDLRGLLDQEGRLPTKRALLIALDLADALTRTHRLDIIHRDIKPENILLAGDGIPRLTDFGIANVRGDTQLTGEKSLIGTVPYLSPEAFSGKILDERSDIWSFGVLLFEMLAGELPFPGQNIRELITAIMQEAPQDIQALNHDLPNQLVDLIYRMLIKNPTERTPSVRLVGAELEAIIKGYSVTPIDFPSVSLPDFDKKSVFASPLPAISRRHNLKPHPTPLIGRQSEMDQLTRLIKDPQVRLITILGPGGMGKSRLATEIGLKHLDAFSDGTYMVELAPLNDPANIPAAIADVVNYPFKEGADHKAQVVTYFENKHVLLIMDNFEHILGGACIVNEILAIAPKTKILVTSREKINLSAENVFAIAGMIVPDLGTYSDTGVLDHDVIQLFLQGAARTKVDFEIKGDDLTHISKICQLVDGIPLGILLATAWVDILSPEEIAKEIQSSIDFLETDTIDIPDRHRSMRAVFEYSLRLLTDEERKVFMYMSVFQGGCTRSAAQAISGASIRLLTKLVNKSVLQRDLSTGRFQIHQLARQLAAELLERYSERTDIQRRHAHHFLELAAGLEDDIKGKRQLEALNEIEVDFENMRAAWLSAIKNQEAKLVDKSLESLHLMTRFRSKFADGYELFQKAREKWAIAGDENGLAGRLLVRYIPSDQNPEKIYRQGLQAAEQHRRPAEITYARNQLGRVLAHSFTEETPLGLSMLEQCLLQFQEMGDEFSTARVLDDLSFSYTFSNMQQKIDYARQSVEIRRRIQDNIGLANALLNLALAYLVTGELIGAKNLHQEGLDIARKMNDQVYIAWHSIFLLQLITLAGEKNLADNYYREVKQIVEEVNDLDLTIEFSYTQILILIAEEKYQQAKEIFDHIRAKAAAAGNNQHTLGLVSLGSFISIGLGEIDQLQAVYVPQIQQLKEQLPELNSLLPYDLITPITASLIANGEYSHAATNMGKLQLLAMKNEIVGYTDRFPIYKKLIAELKENLKR